MSDATPVTCRLRFGVAWSAAAPARWRDDDVTLWADFWRTDTRDPVAVSAVTARVWDPSGALRQPPILPVEETAGTWRLAVPASLTGTWTVEMRCDLPSVALDVRTFTVRAQEPAAVIGLGPSPVTSVFGNTGGVTAGPASAILYTAPDGRASTVDAELRALQTELHDLDAAVVEAEAAQGAAEAARGAAQDAADTAAALAGAAYLQIVPRVAVPGLSDAATAGEVALDVAGRLIEYRRADGSGVRLDPLATTLFGELVTAARVTALAVPRVVVPGLPAAPIDLCVDTDGRVIDQVQPDGAASRAVAGVGLDPVMTASTTPVAIGARVVVPGIGDCAEVAVDSAGRVASAIRASDGASFARGDDGGLVRLGLSADYDPLAYDLVIYGGTLSAIMAAKRATLRGLRVCVVEPTAHLGGVVAGGLVITDRPQPSEALDYLVAGDTRQFFVDINLEYGGGANPRWVYEPKVAERIANRTLLNTGATVVLASRLHGPGQLHVEGGRIRAISTAMGWVRGRAFLDASYEMDLGRFAGAPYRLGRESVAAFGEPSAGYKPGSAFTDPGGPYSFSSDTQWPLVAKPTDLAPGDADDAIQTYSFRHVLSSQAGNTIPFERPAGYDPARYELLRQMILNRGLTSAWEVISAEVIPNTVVDGGGAKRCINNQKLISIELNGHNFHYPLATQPERDAYAAMHAEWQKGLYWFLQNDPACPADVRASFAGWGLPADEFLDSPHGRGFGHQLYIREAVRLNGLALLRQQDVCGYAGGTTTRATSIMGWRYFLDVHPVRVYREGATFRGEGPTGVSDDTVPYEIPAECLMPSAGPSNLLVSVCLSTTHVAWMPTRMEPVFMMAGEAAGEIAAQCLAAGDIAVSRYNYPQLAAALTERSSTLKVQTP